MPLPPLKKFLASARGASWRVGSLVLVTALIWTAYYQRWTFESWQLPTDYVGDAHEMLARIKAASEGNSIPLLPEVIERLGAPFGADWNSYPTPDKPWLLALGALSHLTGLFAAVNVGLLLAQVTAALAFYVTARWLGCRWEWAWAGALLFAYTYSSFHRGLAHFSFVFTWTVPLGLLAVWLVAQSKRLEWRSPGAWVSFGVAFAFGIGNPYNLLFWGQLLIWALIVQWLGPRRRANLLIGLSAGGVALLAFFITNAEVWLHTEEPDGLPLLSRNYGGTERYALKPMEMFIPSQYHRWDWLAFFGHRYARWSEWRGEPYLPYLGIVGIVGLVWLVVISIRRLVARQAPPGQALSASWLLAYATVGGLTNVIAFFFGMQIFRATNRVTIFISALVLAFLVVRLSRLTAKWPAHWRIAVAMAVAVIGILDQLPARWPDEVYARMNADARSDRELGRKLDAMLPKGAMIFQLPVLGFPEVVPPHRLADYEHFRLYLATDNPRFSYGAAKFRARSRWQRDMESLPVDTLVRRLESYGFSALYINRKGYEDQAEEMLQELKKLGYHRLLHGDVGNQVVVFLNPAAHPVLPLGRMLTFGRGWNPRPDDGVRWAGERAALSFFNPYPHPLQVRLRLELVGVSPRVVTLEHNDRRVGSVTTGDAPVPLELPEVTLAPGINRFVLRSSEPARRLGTGRYQLRAFGLKDSSLRFAPGQVAGDWSD